MKLEAKIKVDKDRTEKFLNRNLDKDRPRK